MGVPNGLTEKSPLQSKKFVAFLIGEVTWKVILGLVLILGMKDASIDMMIGGICLAIVIIAGAMEALYIGGQAGLDKYTRIAQIAVGAGQNFAMKGVETTNGQHHKPKPPVTPEAPPAEDGPAEDGPAEGESDEPDVPADADTPREDG